MGKWTFADGCLRESNLNTKEVRISIVEYRPGRATWYVWLGDSNYASLCGSSETLESAKTESVAKLIALIERCRVALGEEAEG